MKAKLLACALLFALAACGQTHGDNPDDAGQGGNAGRGGRGGSSARGGAGGTPARGGAGGSIARGGAGGTGVRGGTGGLGARGGGGGSGGTEPPLSCEGVALERIWDNGLNVSDACISCVCEENPEATTMCSSDCWTLIDCLFDSGCPTADTACIRSACVVPLGGMQKYTTAATLAGPVPVTACRPQCFPPIDELDAGP